MKFRKKPVVIEAVQFQGTIDDALRPHIEGRCDFTFYAGDSRHAPRLAIETLEGRMNAEIGDWIIRGVKGEFYPCKPDIFAATYEVAGDAP